MNLYTSGSTDSTECFSMFLLWTTTSHSISWWTVTVYVYCFTWLRRLVTRRRTNRTPRPPGRHDVACPSINMDLFKAEVRGEAGLAETAFSSKHPSESTRARSQVDLEVREFRSSKSDWRARARTSLKIQFDATTPLQSTIKLFKWAGSIKTFGTILFWRVESCTCKGMTFMLSGVSGCRILIDVLLLGYFCQSINQLDVAIRRHEQIENSI